jgi:hypothetical protein
LEISQARERHLNRVLRSIRSVMRLVIEERDPLQLIRRACASLTEARGFHSAWIALIDDSATPPLVRPVPHIFKQLL